MAKRHHRCNLCGRDFPTSEGLKGHLARRHPKDEVRWWVVAEDPARDLQFTGR